MECDAATTVAALTQAMRRELGIKQAPAALQLALEQLGRRKLLLEPAPALSPSAKLARRAVLKSLAAVAAIPLILTVTAKTARAGASTATHPILKKAAVVGTCNCKCGPGNGNALVNTNKCSFGNTPHCLAAFTCTAGTGSPVCVCG